MPSNEIFDLTEGWMVSWDVADGITAEYQKAYDGPANGIPSGIPTEGSLVAIDGEVLFVKTVVKEPLMNHPNKWRFKIKLIPQNFAARYGGSERGAKHLEMGGSYELLQMPTSYNWQDGSQVDENMPFAQRVITGTLVLESSTRNFSRFSRTMIQKAGRLNANTLEGFAAEHCMFVGANLRQQEKSNGTKYWAIDLMFSYRIVPADENGGPYHWNHFWNKETRKWTRLEPNRFQTDSFSGLV